MWSPYWLLPLLCFWLYPDQHMGLDVSMDRITLMLTCVVLHARDTRQTPRLGKINIIESKERVFNISYRGKGNISL